MSNIEKVYSSLVATSVVALLVMPKRPTPVCIIGHDDVPSYCVPGIIRRVRLVLSS